MFQETIFRTVAVAVVLLGVSGCGKATTGNSTIQGGRASTDELSISGGNLVARQGRLEKLHHAQTVRKLRVLGRRCWIENRSIEPLEDLLEGVTVALAVPSRQIRKLGCAPVQERRVLEHQLIGNLAPSNP